MHTKSSGRAQEILQDLITCTTKVSGRYGFQHKPCPTFIRISRVRIRGYNAQAKAKVEQATNESSDCTANSAFAKCCQLVNLKKNSSFLLISPLLINYRCTRRNTILTKIKKTKLEAQSSCIFAGQRSGAAS